LGVLWYERVKMWKGGFMRKIVVTLIVASLLSATSVAPVFADGWGGYYHGRGGVFNPFWPITAALAIPAAIVGSVASLAVPPPVGYGYAAPPVAVAPPVYPRPVTYYAPGPYYGPRVYVAPRAYYPVRGYYRAYRGGW
jgi:hypothetical protein